MPKGKLRYTGQVSITKDKMKVNFYYDDRSENTRVPLPWNGEYILIEKETGVAR